MNKQIDYIVIERKYKEELANDVAEKMKEGWECQGGVSIIKESFSICYLQAMVKYEETINQ